MSVAGNQRNALCLRPRNKRLAEQWAGTATPVLSRQGLLDPGLPMAKGAVKKKAQKRILAAPIHLFQFAQRPGPVPFELPGQSSVGQDLAISLAGGTVVGFVGGVADSLHGCETNRAGLVAATGGFLPRCPPVESTGDHEDVKLRIENLKLLAHPQFSICTSQFSISTFPTQRIRYVIVLSVLSRHYTC